MQRDEAEEEGRPWLPVNQYLQIAMLVLQFCVQHINITAAVAAVLWHSEN